MEKMKIKKQGITTGEIPGKRNPVIDKLQLLRESRITERFGINPFSLVKKERGSDIYTAL